MPHDLRCNSKKHAVLSPGEYIEVKCDSRFCGAKRGTVILHRFSIETGEMIKTIQFKNPERNINA